MNLVQLKYFQAVCSYRTVSNAAEYLHISQPSLSCAIKELESEFGVLLFRRHHRGMKLTSEGEVLYKMSGDLISRAEQVETVMKDLGRERKTLRLGVPPMIGSLILPRIYSEFLPKYSDMQLDIIEGGRRELLSKLNEDYADMILLPHNCTVEDNLYMKRVTGFEIACCVSKDSPIASKELIQPSDLADMPLVLFKNSFFQTEEIKKWFDQAHITPNILMQTEQLSTVHTLISNGIAAGFMFRELTESHPNLVSVPTNKPISVDISLVWKKDAYFSGSMKKFGEYIENNYKEKL